VVTLGPEVLWMPTVFLFNTHTNAIFLVSLWMRTRCNDIFKWKIIKTSFESIECYSYTVTFLKCSLDLIAFCAEFN